MPAVFETPAGRLAFRADGKGSKMSTASPAVSDMLVTVKSREIQRALLAEMRGDRAAAARHFLADDYRESGDGDLALRSRLHAASCFWRGREKEKSQGLLGELLQEHPSQAAAIQQVADELARDHPPAQAHQRVIRRRWGRERSRPPGVGGLTGKLAVPLDLEVGYEPLCSS
jgi:HPt (histidine-containing phosphotransfer) domain-containing protein